MIGIVVSRADHASEHIGERLLELADWTERRDDSRPDAEGGGTYYRTEGFELRTFDDLHIRLGGADEAFGGAADPDGTADADSLDLLAFVSRHSGDTGPLLSAHFTGNFGPAEYGGEPGRLAPACPNAAAEVLDALAARAPPEYEVAMESTHHGPTAIDVPSMFVELGSGEEQWEDPEGARAVARAVLDLRGVAPDRERQLVGLGGGHYAPRFTRVVRETPWAVGHVGADWQLDAADPAEREDVIRRAFEASGAEHALVDGDREYVAETVEKLGYEVVTETWLREVGDLDLDLVAALEARLSTVEAGLRFGDLAREADPDGFEVVALPDDLLGEAQGVDPDAARTAVAGRTIAFETVESGTRARGRAAVRGPDDREAIVASLAEILEAKYDEVTREDGAVVARAETFDPDLARTLGVPEGPAFGKLADGEAVTVNGERIPPEAVTSERTVRFPL